jgi:hypothetical protein
MHYKLFLTIGSAITTSVIATIAVAMANPTQPKTCFMETTNGKTIDLTSLCGQSSTASSSLIDPNMPVEIVMPSSDKPSAMWQSIPDAPTAPIAGGTYQQPLSATVQTIPGSAANSGK